jgi:type II secretory pathway pseudopilin PulG
MDAHILKNQKGFSMMEALVGAALSIIALSLGYSMLQNSQRQQMQAERAAKRNQAQALMERQIGGLLTSMSDAVVNPAQSLLWGSDRHENVGPTWNRPGVTLTEAEIPKVTLDGFQTYLNSHIISDYRLSVDGDTNSVGRTTKNLMISRCIDGRANPSSYTSTSQILALKAPILRGGSIFCCDTNPAGAVDIGRCSQSPYFWPSIFVLKGGGGIEKIPTDSDRQGIPGMGFVLSFDKNPPDVYHVDYLFIINRCTSGAALKTGKCPVTNPGASVEADVNKLVPELKIEIKRISKPISSDITGGSFINLGPKTIEVK